MTTKEILLKALQGKYAIGAFNACNIETLKPILQAATKLKSPVLIEASEGEVEYIGKKELSALIRIYKHDLGLPIILNLDHAPSLDTCIDAIEAGFDYVHFDGSKLPFEENIRITSEVVRYAHERNVLVEGEIDHIEGSSADHTHEDPAAVQKKGHYTDPEQAREFVLKTGIDTFASFIGNLHGVYATQEHLNLELLKQIRETIPNTFLSLHGASGLIDQEVMNAIKIGVVKINVNTDMRMAFKNTLQKSLDASDEIAFYKLTAPAIAAVQEVVEHKIQIFGSAKRI